MKPFIHMMVATSVPLLGQRADGPPLRDEQTFVTELQNVPEGWLAVGGLLLLALLGTAVVWMYRHEGRAGASARLRTALAGVRLLVVLLLALILLEPVRVRILRRWVDSYTLVLVDDSASMDLMDRYVDPAGEKRVRRVMGEVPEAGERVRRMSIVQRILESDDRAFLRGLAKNNRIRLYTYSDAPLLIGSIPAGRESPRRAFASSALPSGDASTPTHSPADRPRPAGPEKDEAATDTLEAAAAPASLPDPAGPASQDPIGVGEVPLDFAATGPSTNIERAVRRSVESLAGAPVAAVVVLTDGGFNQGASAEEVARFARDRRIPVHVVGVGDPSAPVNARVVEVLAPPNAFQQDPFEISVRVAAEGLADETLQLELHESRRSGDPEASRDTSRVVARRTVRLGAGETAATVGFQQRQNDVGRFVYTVNIVPVPGETISDDNTRQTTVNVIEARTRVLLVSGGPSWDYRFLSRLLTRDPTFDVSCWLQSADYTAVRDGNTIIDHLPAVPEELFDYDVIVLMAPNPQEIDPAWCRLLDTFVTQHGGGLLLTAARPFTPALMRDRTLKDLHLLLPVTPDPEADLILNEIGHYQVNPSPIVVPPTALRHSIMKLDEDAGFTKLAWQSMGKIYWHYPVLREKPLATVLMRHGNPKMRNAFGEHVLAAVQFVGSGRTGFLAFDGTWRWREHGVEHFDRFWVQLLRYLAEGKLLGGTKRGILVTEADEYALGETVTVSARLVDPQYKPLRRDQVLAQYAVDGESTEFVLTARPEADGWFDGSFVPDRTGTYEIALKLTDSWTADFAAPLDVGVREIRVSRPNLEIARPQMDRNKLVTLAENSHEGRYFDMDEAAKVPDVIADLHEEIPIRSRPRTLWDNWITLTLLIVLLSVEWAVRKWNRLL